MILVLVSRFEHMTAWAPEVLGISQATLVQCLGDHLVSRIDLDWVHARQMLFVFGPHTTVHRANSWLCT